MAKDVLISPALGLLEFFDGAALSGLVQSGADLLLRSSGTLTLGDAGTTLRFGSSTLAFTSGAAIQVGAASTLTLSNANAFLVSAAPVLGFAGRGTAFGEFDLTAQNTVYNQNLTTLVGGTNFGALVRGPMNGHVVVALHGDDTSDSFSVVSYTADSAPAPTKAPNALLLRLGRDGQLRLPYYGTGVFLSDANGAVTVGSVGVAQGGTGRTTAPAPNKFLAFDSGANQYVATAFDGTSFLQATQASAGITGAWSFTQAITGSVTGNAGTADRWKTGRTIAFTGAASGSVVLTGAADASVTLTPAPVGTAGTYTKVTTDSAGRVTIGENPTTLAGYGITDAAAGLKALTGGGAFAETRYYQTVGADQYYYTTAAVTGSIKLVLPRSWTGTHLTFAIQIRENNGRGHTVLYVGGTNAASAWTNGFAFQTGSNTNVGQVRLAHDGTACCILIGSGSTVWAAGTTVALFEVWAAGTAPTGLGSGYTISAGAAETGITVSSTHSVASAGNALTLNGQPASYYLDFANITTNRPTTIQGYGITNGARTDVLSTFAAGLKIGNAVGDTVGLAVPGGTAALPSISAHGTANAGLYFENGTNPAIAVAGSLHVEFGGNWTTRFGDPTAAGAARSLWITTNRKTNGPLGAVLSLGGRYVHDAASFNTVGTGANENGATALNLSAALGAPRFQIAAVQPTGAGGAQTGVTPAPVFEVWAPTTAGTPATNWIKLSAAVINAAPVLEFTGTDTNVGGTIQTKGTGALTVVPSSTFLSTVAISGALTGFAGGTVNATVPVVSANSTVTANALGLNNRSLKIASGITDSGTRRGANIDVSINDAQFLGTLGSQYGVMINHGHVSGAGAGTINNSVGLYIKGFAGGSSAVTNSWGLYQESEFSGTRNYMGSALTIDASDGEALMVTGGIKVGGDLVVDYTVTAGDGLYTGTGSLIVHDGAYYEGWGGTETIGYRNVAKLDSLTGSAAGTIKITLPQSWTGNLLVLRIGLYNADTASATEIVVSGINGASAWTAGRVFATASFPGNTVRLAHDGTKCCILIGTTGTTWAYPKIIVREVTVARGTNVGAYAGGWTISQITSESGITVSATPAVNADFQTNLGAVSVASDANTLARRDGSGNLYANLFYSDQNLDTASFGHVVVQVARGPGQNSALRTAAPATFRSAMGLVTGTHLQAWSAQLDAVAAFAATGFIVRTGANAFAARSFAAGSAKILLSNADGLTGNPTFDVVESNLALNNLGGTLGVAKGGTGAVSLAAGYLRGNGTAAVSTVTTIPEADIADGLIFPRLSAAETITGLWTTSRGIAATTTTVVYAAFQPTDYATGNPALLIQKVANAGAGRWDLALGDGTNNSGTLNIDAAAFTHAGSPVRTAANFVAGTDYLAPAAIGVTVQGYSAQLMSVANLSATGLIVRTAANTVAARALAAGSTKISLTNADGVAGNPTIDLVEANLTLGNLGGTLGVTKGGTGATTLAPGYLRGNDAGPISSVASIPEADIADGTIFPRLAATESITGQWTFGTGQVAGLANRALNLIGTNAVMRVARPNTAGVPAVELIEFNTSNAITTHWDFYAGTGTFVIRERTGGDNNRLVISSTAITFNGNAVRHAGNFVAGTDYLAPAAIGVTVQAYNTNLAALAGLTGAADTLAYFTGAAAMATTAFSATGRTLVGGADAAAMRTTLGLVIGTHVQAYSAGLASFATLAAAGSSGVLQITGTNTVAYRATGVAAATDLLTRGDGDGRYVQIGGGQQSGDITITSAAPSLRFSENDQTAPAGLWRIIGNDGRLWVQRNTASAANFSTMTSPLYFTDTDVAVFAVTPTVGTNAIRHAGNFVAGTDYLAPAAIGVTVQGYSAQLAALSAFSATGILARTGTNTFAARALAAGSTKVTVTNADGVAGNPAIDVAEANLSLNNLGGTLGVAKGGTGAVSLAAGYLRGNGTAAVSTVTTIPEADIADGTIFPRLGANETITKGWTFQVTPATTRTDYLAFLPTDFGSGKPGLFITKAEDAGTWALFLYDGAGNSGTIAVTAGNFTYNGNAVLTTSAVGSTVQAYSAQLLSLANLAATGFIVRTGTNTVLTRTWAAGSAKISLTNPDGVAGNPTIDVAEANLSLNNIGGTLGVAKGGTGATTLTGYVKGSGAAALTAVSQIPEADIADGTVFPRLASQETVTALWAFSLGTATTNLDYLRFTPTDWGTGKPFMSISKDATASRWVLALWDGTNNAGTIHLSATNVTTAGLLTANTLATNYLTVLAGSGLNGGEIALARGPTDAGLGGDVIADVYDGQFRIFENGGGFRGAYLYFNELKNGANRLLHSGNLSIEGMKTGYQITGGGTVSVTAGGAVTWSSRFIIISAGNGAHWAGAGFYQFLVPGNGTVIPVYGDPGTTSVTATAAGIPLPGWYSLYAVPTIGSGADSYTYAIVHYVNAYTVPSHWIPLVRRNSDSQMFYFPNGVVLAAGQSRDMSHRVWTEGNDGANSGLDADLLDGLQSTSFLRSDVDGAISKALIIQAGNATTPRDFLQFTPTDYGAGKPRMSIQKTSQADSWWIIMDDGTGGYKGLLNFQMTNVAWNGATVATQTWVTGTAFTNPTFTSSLTISSPNTNATGALYFTLGSSQTSINGTRVNMDANGSGFRIYESGSPFRGVFFDFAETGAQSKLWHSGNFTPANYATKASPTISDPTFTGNLFLPVAASAGLVYFSAGTGDGASYTTYNTKLTVWTGLGMADVFGNINGFYASRTGTWDVKGGYSINGVPINNLRLLRWIYVSSSGVTTYNAAGTSSTTASGSTWNRLSDETFYYIITVGGGGGGAAGARGAATVTQGGGGGGAGGAIAKDWVPASMFDSTAVNCNVGSAGFGGAASGNDNQGGGFGTSGGSSEILVRSGMFLRANGGFGGGPGAANSQGAGGAQYDWASGVPMINQGGGSGGYIGSGIGNSAIPGFGGGAGGGGGGFAANQSSGSQGGSGSFGSLYRGISNSLIGNQGAANTAGGTPAAPVPEYLLGRGGGGGGSRVGGVGGSGGAGVGLGGAGGGGGASTNGSASGAGGAGSPGGFIIFCYG